MILDRVQNRFISALKEEINNCLAGLGDFPKADPFEHGVQVGTYRGLKTALNLLEAVYEEIASEEARL